MLEKLRNFLSAIKIIRLLPIIIVICAGVTLSFYLFKTQRAEENNLIKADFELVAHDRVSAFKSIITKHFQLMNQIKAFFDSSQKIQRKEFHTFVTTAIQNKGIQALEWIPRVTDQKRSEYESVVREKGYPDFSFTERNAQGQMVKALRREEYFPVYFVEPLEGNRPAFGFDLASSQPRLEALNFSRETGKMIATGRIRLVQETGEQFGFLVFLPVYRNGVPIDSTDLRIKNLEGFVLGVFRIGDILESALKPFKAGGVDIELRDISAPTEKSFLYHHHSRLKDDKNISHIHDSIEKVGDVSFTASLNIANRKWKIICTPIPEFIASRTTSRPFEILLAGLLFTGMVAVYLLINIGRTAKVEKLVTERTIELKESEERIRSIVDNVVHGIITINERGIVENFNYAAEQIFQYSASEVTGKNVKMLMPEPYHNEHDGYIGNYLNTRKPKVIGIGREVVGKRKDDTTFPMHLAVSEMNREGKSTFVGIVIDISEQKEAEKEIEMAKGQAEKYAKEAESANEAKSDFLASMSHEIRTPMNAILGMADLLEETELEEDQKKYVKTFKGAGVTLLNLVNDILDFSKIEAGQIHLEKIDFDLKEVIDSTMEIMAVRAREKRLQINAHIEKDVPKYFVGDPSRVKQILFNLIGNAIKFTEKGDVVIRVENEPDSTEQGILRFSVSDTGIGIPKEKCEQIFERFQQADSSTTRKFGGTGLGLAISKQLIERMGGHIWVESEVNKGSTFFFTVTFDVQKESKRTEDSLEAKSKETKTKLEAPVALEDLPPLNILLVEDTKDNRVLINAFLKKTPFKLDMAENGKVAVDKFKSGKYDIVLMDMQMPVMDGYEATLVIRQWEKETDRTATPIVALTAHALKGDEQKSFAVGCNGHITKPLKKTKLIETIVQYT